MHFEAYIVKPLSIEEIATKWRRVDSMVRNDRIPEIYRLNLQGVRDELWAGVHFYLQDCFGQPTYKGFH